VHQFGAPLPVGLQVMCRNGADAHALAIGMAIEAHFGPLARPDLSGI
jgi:aspartyl-tRNA(Asn)/glutamyl-tRNA(Gln) amidotransferase subunit A